MRIALTGMSTTGKTKIGKDLIGMNLSLAQDIELRDSDAWIAERILGDKLKPGIARIYLTLGRAVALKKIEDEEENFLQAFMSGPQNVIFALGPGVGLRPSWKEFKKTTKLVKLDKAPEEILTGLKLRLENIKKQIRANFPNLINHPQYGCWEIGMTLDEQLKELPTPDALRNIQSKLDEMNDLYGGGASVWSTEKTTAQEVLVALGIMKT